MRFHYQSGVFIRRSHIFDFTKRGPSGYGVAPLVRGDVCNVPASRRIREAHLKGGETESGGGVDCRDDQSDSGYDSSSTEEALGSPEDDGSSCGEDSRRDEEGDERGEAVSVYRRAPEGAELQYGAVAESVSHPRNICSPVAEEVQLGPDRGQSENHNRRHQLDQSWRAWELFTRSSGPE